MVDTIVMRLHGIGKHRGVIKSLDRLNTEGYTTSQAKLDPEEVKRLRNMGVKDTGEILSIMKRNKTGEFLIRTKVAKQMNASSHYQFAYFVNYTLDFIELNFFLPKYIYGSNVVQFVDHIGDAAYTFHECWQLEENIQRAYNVYADEDDHVRPEQVDHLFQWRRSAVHV